MARIDGIFFGYRRVFIEKENIAKAISILLRGKINARARADGELIVRERDIAKMRTLFFGKIEYYESEALGLPGMFKRIKYKAGLITALVFSLFLVFLSSNIVWDIRIKGNEKTPDSTIAYALSENGFSIGDFWWNIDRSEVEAAVLLSSDALSWININRRGTVAYVKVSEKEDVEEDTKAKTGYANIVADTDCVIEEITVKRGSAMVKVGDSVKAGDVLISGIVVSESGAELCYAEGNVVGRVSDTVSVTVKREHQDKLFEEKTLQRLDIKIFGFSINIFKRYGKVDEECVIIEEIKDFSLFGKCKLPFWLTVSSVSKEVSNVSDYTDEELVRVASSRLNSLTLTKLSASDLVRIRTLGEYTDDGYRMKNEIVFLRDVGKTAEFSVNED